MIWEAALAFPLIDIRRKICPTGPPNLLPTPESSSSNIMIEAPLTSGLPARDKS